MAYLPPFEALRRTLTVTTRGSEKRVEMPYEQLVSLLKQVLSGIAVDEAWYLANNEDIAKAVRKGTIASPTQHFIEDGYFEGRAPFPMKVDEAWYLAQYPDVAEGIRRRAIPSAQAHFDQNGYREGRLPHAL